MACGSRKDYGNSTIQFQRGNLYHPRSIATAQSIEQKLDSKHAWTFIDLYGSQNWNALMHLKNIWILHDTPPSRSECTSHLWNENMLALSEEEQIAFGTRHQWHQWSKPTVANSTETVLAIHKVVLSSWHGRAQHTQQGSSYPALVAAGSRWRPSSLPTMVTQPGAEIAITCAGMQPYAAGFMNSPLRKADSVQYCLFGDLGAVSFGMRGTWHGII